VFGTPEEADGLHLIAPRSRRPMRAMRALLAEFNVYRWAHADRRSPTAPEGPLTGTLASAPVAQAPLP